MNKSVVGAIITYRALLAVLSGVTTAVLFYTLTFSTDTFALARTNFSSALKQKKRSCKLLDLTKFKDDFCVRGGMQVSMVSLHEQSEPFHPGLQTHLPHSQVPWSGPAHGRRL